MYKRSVLDYFYLFIKGIAMGAANKVPGVSGGIIALVTGFYEELIYSFQKINTKALLLLRKGKFRSFGNYINIKFLLAVNLGSIFSFFSVSILLDYLLNRHEVMVWSFFFGMIIGSIYYIQKSIRHWRYVDFAILIFGLLLGLLISFSDPLAENRNLLFILACGVISVSGMTLPGLSGSFILIILGNYTLLLVRSVAVLFQVITQVFSGDFSFLQNQETVEVLLVLLAFGTGSLLGLISLSHLLGYLLKRYHNQVIVLLIGFIAGSLGSVWPWKIALDANGVQIPKNNYDLIDSYQRFLPEFNIQVFWAMVWVFVGLGVILLIDYAERKKENA